MTVDEFNEKYKEYLEKGHYGLDIGNENIIKYLDDVFKDLIKIPGFKYSQIKEKFGSSRFYTNLYELMGKPGILINNKIESDLDLLIKYR